jgi:hypothetical protein
LSISTDVGVVDYPYTQAVTTDIKKVQHLIDFPWDDYYDEYYIKGCGGTFGMPADIHPFKG